MQHICLHCMCLQLPTACVKCGCFVYVSSVDLVIKAVCVCLCEYQAVIQSPFSNDGSPAAETIGGEARFSYIPPAAVSDATATGVSAHPAEPTRSHTAGELDSVHTDAKRCDSNCRNKKFIKTRQFET